MSPPRDSRRSCCYEVTGTEEDPDGAGSHMGWIFNEHRTEPGAARTFHSDAYQVQHRRQGTASRGLSLSSPSSEIFPLPIPSLRILLSLSYGVVLLHPAIASLVTASLQTAKAGVEEWPRGKAQEGNTVDSYE
jgi:hypothetical protein